MQHKLIDWASRFANPHILRLIYILLVLLALALAGGAPGAYPSTGT